MQQFFAFVVNHWILFLALVVISVLLAATLLSEVLLGFKSVTPAAATQLINREGAVVLDVREEREFRAGHIVNALHVPLTALEARLKDLDKMRETPLIVTCQNGQFSARAGDILRKHGFTKIYKLGGGLMTWKDANLPLVTT